MKKTIGIVLVVLVAAGGAWYFFPHADNTVTTDGIVYHNTDAGIIKLDLVRAGVTVLPKFTVTGEARGPWFFEGSFPVQVLDKDGTQLTIAPAQAEGEWATSEFVRFSVVLNVGDYSGPATLVLFKDNPSGLPENDASVSIPVDVFDVN